MNTNEESLKAEIKALNAKNDELMILINRNTVLIEKLGFANKNFSDECNRLRLENQSIRTIKADTINIDENEKFIKAVNLIPDPRNERSFEKRVLFKMSEVAFIEANENYFYVQMKSGSFLRLQRQDCLEDFFNETYRDA